MSNECFNPCIVIPHFDHSAALASVLACISVFNVPIILVDDGSALAQREVARLLSMKYSAITFLQHPENQGKGSAIVSAIKCAHKMHFTHAFQVDADGQHTLGDIPKFLEVARDNPQALILGAPHFGIDAPWIRVQGRKLTTLILALESGSFKVQDGLCGFRIYPVAATYQIISSSKLHRRMGFDTEIIVRLLWRQTLVVNIPTAVTYPIDGISHFRYFRDNFELILLHIKLTTLCLMQRLLRQES